MTVGKYYDMEDEVYDQRETLLAARSDHPNGGSYETQAERFGSRPYASAHAKPKPVVKAERSFTFQENDIKIILAKYVEEHYNVEDVSADDVTGDYRQADFRDQFDHSPGYCRFIVKVSG